MQLGRFEVVRVLGRPGLFLVREIGASWGRRSLLARAVDSGATDETFFRTERALLSNKCPSIPALLDAGHDEERQLDYYVFAVDAIGEAKLLSEVPSNETHLALEDVARAIQTAHASGIVYRNFVPLAFLIVGRRAFLYDLARAGVLSDDGTVSGLSSVEPFDPPEATRQRYDGMRGDVYGFGMLVKRVTDHPRLLALAQRMTVADPGARLDSLDEVFRG